MPDISGATEALPIIGRPVRQVKAPTVFNAYFQANDIDGAKALLANHPHLKWTDGCDIEVHETIPM